MVCPVNRKRPRKVNPEETVPVGNPDEVQSLLEASPAPIPLSAAMPPAEWKSVRSARERRARPGAAIARSSAQTGCDYSSSIASAVLFLPVCADAERTRFDSPALYPRKLSEMRPRSTSTSSTVTSTTSPTPTTS